MLQLNIKTALGVIHLANWKYLVVVNIINSCHRPLVELNLAWAARLVMRQGWSSHTSVTKQTIFNGPTGCWQCFLWWRGARGVNLSCFIEDVSPLHLTLLLFRTNKKCFTNNHNIWRIIWGTRKQVNNIADIGVVFQALNESIIPVNKLEMLIQNKQMLRLSPI